jgi:hypothetical protein
VLSVVASLEACEIEVKVLDWSRLQAVVHQLIEANHDSYNLPF